MDLAKARRSLAAVGLDALLLLSPRHVYYATGYRMWFLSMYGEAGYGAVILPTDPAATPAAIVTDVEEGPFRETAPVFSHVVTFPAWVAYAAVPAHAGEDIAVHLAADRGGQPAERTGLIDRDGVMRRLVDLLRELRLDRGRLGAELSFLSARDHARLTSALPDLRLIEARGLVEELRAIKSEREVALLRRGTEIAEAAIEEVVSSVKEGMPAGEIARRYRAAVMTRADGGDVTGARITLRVGPDVLSPRASGNHALRRGDLLFLDCGVEVSGYWADIGRTFAFGAATPAQSKIYGTLRQAFEEATSRLAIGRPVSEVFVAGLNAARGTGLPTYTRGNLGHGVGLHPAPELPIVSREETRLLASDYVVSIEVPYYVDGIGALTVEDTFALREDGVEVFNRLSRDLVEIDV